MGACLTEPSAEPENVSQASSTDANSSYQISECPVMRNSTPMVTSRKRMTISAPTSHSSASPYTARKRCIALSRSAAATDLFSKCHRAVDQFLGAGDFVTELIVDRFARRDEGRLVDVVDLHPVLLQLFEQVALVLDRCCVDER